MADPMDQPEAEGYNLVMPFVVTASNGGPYEDAAFAAGWQAGEIDQALKTSSTVRADRVRFAMVHTALLPQLELIAMHRGYPRVLVNRSDEYQEWADVTFCASPS